MPDALASTAQDLARGKRTEVDSLNGYVAARGAALAVETPVNRTLWSLVRLRERRQS
jgi:2-dehydropantoate 2-reductase